MGEKRKIALLFCGAVIIYGIIISFFASTVHIDVDEELYVALARSFHYNGRFEYENQILNYSCVLYSMLISLAYYFYSPETILFSMRMIGVIAMCSSVFPIYLLAKDVLSDSKKALYLSAFLLIFPYMFDSAYLMQEVLNYPLFMWTLYFLYEAYGKENSKKLPCLILGAVFSVLCVFTKTYMFFIPVALNLCALYHAVSGKKIKEELQRILIYDGIYLLLFAGMYFMIFAINGFERGSNHYSSQFSNLFPIGMNTLIYGIAGCVFYFVFLVINTGFFPMRTVFYQWLHEKKKTWIINFLSVSILFLIIEIVFMVVLTEEGTGTLPHKFLFRYFQIFMPPVLMLFIRYCDESRLIRSRKFIVAMEMNLSAAFVYFLIMKGNTRQAIIDGHVFLFVENLTKYILPYADLIVTAALMLILIILHQVCRKNSNCLRMINRTCIAGVVFFWIIEAVQLPYYSNVIAGGKRVESDSIKIAEYLNEEDYEHVYYVYTNLDEKNSYLRNFYGYITQSYEIIPETDMGSLICTEAEERCAVLSSSDLTDKTENLKPVDLNNEVLFLYESAMTDGK